MCLYFLLLSKDKESMLDSYFSLYTVSVKYFVQLASLPSVYAIGSDNRPVLLFVVS